MLNRLKYLLFKETELMLAGFVPASEKLYYIRDEINLLRSKLIKESEIDGLYTQDYSLIQSLDSNVLTLTLSNGHRICDVYFNDTNNYNIIPNIELPEKDFYPINKDWVVGDRLSQAVNKVRNLVSTALQVRADNKVKVRQPLQKLTVICPEQDAYELSLFKEDILSELNVEEVEFLDPSEASKYSSAKVLPNFRSIGSKFKHLVPSIKSYITKANPDSLLNDLNSKGSIDFDINGEKVSLTSEDIKIEQVPKAGFASASYKNFVVVLDLNITDMLRHKALVRDLRSAIQTERKNKNLSIQDRIDITFWCDKQTQKVIEDMQDSFKSQTMTDSFSFIESDGFKFEIN